MHGRWINVRKREQVAQEAVGDIRATGTDELLREEVRKALDALLNGDPKSWAIKHLRNAERLLQP